METEFEKTDRLVDLHFVYAAKVASVNRAADEQRLQRQREGEAVDEDLEAELYLTRLDGGLFTLQIIDHIMLRICTCDEDSSVSIQFDPIPREEENNDTLFFFSFFFFFSFSCRTLQTDP